MNSGILESYSLQAAGVRLKDCINTYQPWILLQQRAQGGVVTVMVHKMKKVWKVQCFFQVCISLVLLSFTYWLDCNDDDESFIDDWLIHSGTVMACQAHTLDEKVVSLSLPNTTLVVVSWHFYQGGSDPTLPASMVLNRQVTGVFFSFCCGVKLYN